MGAGVDREFSFSKERLLALPIPPAGSRAVYRDSKASGLQIRVTSNGVKTFSVYRRMKGGQPERITLGRFPDMTVEQARRMAAAVNAEIEEGANPAEVKRAAKAEATFGEVFEEFLVHKRNRAGAPLSDRTREEYRDAARLHLGAFLPQRLSRITRESVALLHRQIGKSAPFQANRVKALVSSVMGYARERGHLQGENPAAQVKSFAEPSRDRFAQATELSALFEAMAESSQRDFFLLAILTGARRSDIQAMRWEQINKKEAIWRIPTTKNGTPQNVTLSPEAIAVLQAREEERDASPFVFPGSGKTGHLVEPKKAWQTILSRAGLSDLRIHDLRRTLGSWQAKTGASLAIIGKSLNHKTPQATAIYARLDLDPVRQSVNTATAAMLEAAGMKDVADVLPIKKGSVTPRS